MYQRLTVKRPQMKYNQDVKTSIWRLWFLGVTVLALGMELWASFDSDPKTEPWTELIVQYISAEVTIAVIGGLSVWLFVHFILRYSRKHKTSKNHDTKLDH